MRVQTYYLSQLNELEVKISIKRLIDENKTLSQYYHPDIQSQLMFSCQLFTNGEGVLPIRRTRFMKKLLYDEPIIFNYKYKDLTYNAFIAINIWSTGKSYNPQKPLGSTIVSLFDENLIMRTGKYHLMIWPDRQADTSSDTTTPGITIDKNIKQLNYITEKVDLYQKNIKNIKIDNKSQETLKLKLLYTYKLIPAAFLEVEFPTFNYPIVFQDQQYLDYKSVNIKQEQRFDEVLLYSDPDYENKLSNPQQQLFFYFIRQNQNENPQDLRPTKEQFIEMQNLIKKPQRTQLKPNQQFLFYKYRYFLMNNNKFLINFLHSVKWNNQRQQEEALILLKKWNKIDKDDALHLLSANFCANNLYNKQSPKSVSSMKIVRRYAVQIINDNNNSKQIKISQILLQLVQALRYQAFDDSALMQMLIDKGLKDRQIATLLYWYLKAQRQQIQNNKQSQQAQLLNEISSMYTTVYKTFQQELSNKNEQFYISLKSQEKFVEQLRTISKSIKGMKKDIQKKKQQLRKKITDINWNSMPNLQFPLNTNQTIKQPIKNQCTIFSSAMAPFKLAFQGFESQQPKKIQLIYKSGDDLRQDQLILQMFSLMDSLLKGVNQDYKLTPYKALACSKSDGFVQFVPKTKTLQQIPNLTNYLSKLTNPKSPIYIQLLKKNGQTQLTQKFINQNSATVSNIIMQNYIFSCAGYCAITYFFGIGDRHLENLLINDTGKIFHIDFGFILGRDPKPYPPPIKLRKQMVEAMGGRQSQNFKKFKFKCLQAYIYLRKYSKLITNLFELMLDSGIKDLNQFSLNGLYQKFCLNMNDQEAQKHFLFILQQSLSAVFANINDRFHIWASYFK